MRAAPAPAAVPASHRGRVRARVPRLPRAVPARAHVRAVERAQPPHAADVEHAGDRRRGSRTSRRATARAARSSSATCSTRPTTGSRGGRRTAPRRAGSSATARRLRVPRDVCGIHNYSDVNRFRTAGTRALMRALGCRRYWLTETGGIMSAGGWPRDGRAPDARDRVPVPARRARAADRARVCVHVVRARDAAVGLRARRAARRTGRRRRGPRSRSCASTSRPARRVRPRSATRSRRWRREALRSWAETQTARGALPEPGGRPRCSPGTAASRRRC